MNFNIRFFGICILGATATANKIFKNEAKFMHRPWCVAQGLPCKHSDTVGLGYGLSDQNTRNATVKMDT